MGSRKDGSVHHLLVKFFAAQEERAKAYAAFEDGFRRHQVEHSSPNLYRVLVERTTERFKDASEKIRQIESELQDMQCTEVAAMLRSVQNAEREKLQLTISLQGLRKAEADRVASHVDASSSALFDRESGCACGAEHDSVSATETDLKSALASTTKALQATVNGINDLLEELRYVLTEEDDLGDPASF